MTDSVATDFIARLREIHGQRRQMETARRRLDEEEERLLAALDGAPIAPQAPQAQYTGVTDILTTQHVTVAQLARHLRTSEKTARGIGNAAGARIQIGGRVLFDLTVVRRHVGASANYRVLPRSSVSNGAQIAENANNDQ